MVAAPYDEVVKTIWTGRMTEAAARYGEVAPAATVCCNACRTCVTANVAGAVIAGLVGAGYGVTTLAKRIARR